MTFVVYSHAKHAEDEHLVEINTIEELIELYEEAREEGRRNIDSGHYCYGLELSINTSDEFGPEDAKYDIMIMNDEEDGLFR